MFFSSIQSFVLLFFLKTEFSNLRMSLKNITISKVLVIFVKINKILEVLLSFMDSTIAVHRWVKKPSNAQKLSLSS